MRTYALVCVAVLLSALAASAEGPEETIQRLKDADPSARAVAARTLGRPSAASPVAGAPSGQAAKPSGKGKHSGENR